MEREIQIIVKNVEDGKIDFVKATNQILKIISEKHFNLITNNNTINADGFDEVKIKSNNKTIMATATIKVEFQAGDNIEGAFKEAIRLATLLGVWCQFDFNGIECFANSHGVIENGVKAYYSETKKKDGLKMAFA